MNTEFFIEQLTGVFPGRELTTAQQVAYREKLRRFSNQERSLLYDALLETCKYFPKVADVYEQARNLGMLQESHEYKPHVWEPTDCRMCGGSGLMAAFWEQEFSHNESGKTQTLKLVAVMPYVQSSGRYLDTQSEVRSVYRCQCPAGEVDTIQKGLPRWSSDHALILNRRWSV